MKHPVPRTIISSYLKDMLRQVQNQSGKRSPVRTQDCSVIRAESVQRGRAPSRKGQWACVDDFLKCFPDVTNEQVVAVLAHAEHSLVET
jgi:hypothetical protein